MSQLLGTEEIEDAFEQVEEDGTCFDDKTEEEKTVWLREQVGSHPSEPSI